MPKSRGAIFGWSVGTAVYATRASDGTPSAVDAARYNSRGHATMRHAPSRAVPIGRGAAGDEPERAAAASDYNRRAGAHAKRGGHARNDEETHRLRAQGRRVITEGVIGWRNQDPDDLWASATERATPKRRRAKHADPKKQRERGKVAHRIHAPLPAVLDAEARGMIAMRMARDLSERYGVPVHFELHSPPGRNDPEQGRYRNFHVHFQMSNIAFDPKAGTWGQVPDGFRSAPDAATGRTRRSLEMDWQRERWAHQVNRALAAANAVDPAGVPLRVDYRSLEQRAREDGQPAQVPQEYLPKAQYRARKRRAAAGIPEPTIAPKRPPVSGKARAAAKRAQADAAQEMTHLDAAVRAAIDREHAAATAYAQAQADDVIDTAARAMGGRTHSSNPPKEKNHAYFDTRSDTTPTGRTSAADRQPRGAKVGPDQHDHRENPRSGEPRGGAGGEPDRGHFDFAGSGRRASGKADGQARSDGDKNRRGQQGDPRKLAKYRPQDWQRANAAFEHTTADQAARAHGLVARLHQITPEEARQRAQARRAAWLRQRQAARMGREVGWQAKRAANAATDFMLDDPDQSAC